MAEVVIVAVEVTANVEVEVATADITAVAEVTAEVMDVVHPRLITDPDPDGITDPALGLTVLVSIFVFEGHSV